MIEIEVPTTSVITGSALKEKALDLLLVFNSEMTVKQLKGYRTHYSNIPYDTNIAISDILAIHGVGGWIKNVQVGVQLAPAQLDIEIPIYLSNHYEPGKTWADWGVGSDALRQAETGDYVAVSTHEIGFIESDEINLLVSDGYVLLSRDECVELLGEVE